MGNPEYDVTNLYTATIQLSLFNFRPSRHDYRELNPTSRCMY